MARHPYIMRAESYNTTSSREPIDEHERLSSKGVTTKLKMPSAAIPRASVKPIATNIPSPSADRYGYTGNGQHFEHKRSDSRPRSSTGDSYSYLDTDWRRTRSFTATSMDGYNTSNACLTPTAGYVHPSSRLEKVKSVVKSYRSRRRPRSATYVPSISSPLAPTEEILDSFRAFKQGLAPQAPLPPPSDLVRALSRSYSLPDSYPAIPYDDGKKNEASPSDQTASKDLETSGFRDSLASTDVILTPIVEESPSGLVNSTNASPASGLPPHNIQLEHVRGSIDSDRSSSNISVVTQPFDIFTQGDSLLEDISVERLPVDENDQEMRDEVGSTSSWNSAAFALASRASHAYNSILAKRRNSAPPTKTEETSSDLQQASPSKPPNIMSAISHSLAAALKPEHQISNTMIETPLSTTANLSMEQSSNVIDNSTTLNSEARASPSGTQVPFSDSQNSEAPALSPGQPRPPISPTAVISLDEVIQDSRKMQYYARWLDEISLSRLLFLCSVDEYRTLWNKFSLHEPESARPSDKPGIPVQVQAYAQEMIKKYLVGTGVFCLYGSARKDLRDAIMRDVNAGGTKSLEAFDVLAARQREKLLQDYDRFKKSVIYRDMMKAAMLPIVSLAEVLSNRAFVNCFWVYLFTRNQHLELSKWMDTEYNLKPVVEKLQGGKGDGGILRGETDGSKDLSRVCTKLVSIYYADEPEAKDLLEKVRCSIKENDKADTKLLKALADFLLKEQETIHRVFQYETPDIFSRFISSDLYKVFVSSRTEDHSSLQKAKFSYDLVQAFRDQNIFCHRSLESSTDHSFKRSSLRALLSQNECSSVSHIVTFHCSTSPGSPQTTLEKREHRATPKTVPLPIHCEEFMIPHMYKGRIEPVRSEQKPQTLVFSTHLGDGLDLELFGCCIVAYENGSGIAHTSADVPSGTGVGGDPINAQNDLELWYPYGVSIFSTYRLFDSLRERLISWYTATNFQSHSVLTDDDFAILFAKFELSNGVQYSESDTQKRPWISPLDFSFRVLAESLTPTTLVSVVAALLIERKVLLASSHFSVLSYCAEALRALLYPFNWAHIYGPILPLSMLDYLQCPTPFIFGFHWDFLSMDDVACLPTDVVLVDLDSNLIIKGPRVQLPASLHERLSSDLLPMLRPTVHGADSLHQSAVSASKHKIDAKGFPTTEIRRCFAMTIKELLGDFGHFRHTLVNPNSEETLVVFDEASYLASSPQEARQFLSELLHTQAFSELVTRYDGITDLEWMYEDGP